MSDEAPKYLRKRDDDFVYHATPMLLQRNDLFPCTVNGKFISTQEFAIPEAKASPEGPGNDPEKIELNALREKARNLKIPGWNNAKKETLEGKIATAEAEAAKED